MKEKLNIQGIKKDIRTNKKLIESYKDHEDDWHIYDTPLGDFAPTFVTVLPTEYAEPLDKKLFVDLTEYGDVFQKYIEDTLAKSSNSKNLTAVEFGGPGSQFFVDFSPDFFKRSVGVCLKDVRIEDDLHQDAKIHHQVLVGDILDTNTNNLLARVKERIQSPKTDFIVSRMMGPLDEIKMNPALLDRIIRSWYEMLNEGGFMLVQFEYLKEHNPNTTTIAKAKAEALMYGQPKSFLQSQIQDWVNLIQDKFPSIEIQIGNGVLRILKKPGSPDELPNLKDLASKS